MNKVVWLKKIPLCLTFCMVCFLFLPLLSFAADFVPLSPNLPVAGGDGAWGGGLNKLINSLFGVAVGAAAVLAVVMVAFGGIEYMTSDSMFKMGNGMERIKGALTGLLIVLASILILKTINPNIVNLNLFQGSASTSTTAPASTTPAPATPAPASPAQPVTTIPPTTPGTAWFCGTWSFLCK